MKKINQFITKQKTPNQILIGAGFCLLFFLATVFFKDGVGSETLWDSSLLVWIAIPFLLLSVAINFWVLYSVAEKKEPFKWQYIIALILANSGLIIYFTS